jgi:hypothetical protein
VHGGRYRTCNSIPRVPLRKSPPFPNPIADPDKMPPMPTGRDISTAKTQRARSRESSAILRALSAFAVKFFSARTKIKIDQRKGILRALRVSAFNLPSSGGA